jgi:hypothetical protein
MFLRRLNGFEVNYPASLTPHSGAAGLNRNARPIWNGIGGRFGSEWVAVLRRNTHLMTAAPSFSITHVVFTPISVSRHFIEQFETLYFHNSLIILNG